ncbi:hypothetical protein [Kitasatospora herbaricolor]|uniref:hypothetical protein n=1 Tax=Kitasatospora herbaricolor TaxID=68217 RepID=UPI002E32050C|nr:hypothetical protein [Kitasatospora herbaricolor]
MSISSAPDAVLTTLGRGLLGPLDTACAWTREHWDELIDAQEAGLARAAGRH